MLALEFVPIMTQDTGGISKILLHYYLCLSKIYACVVNYIVNDRPLTKYRVNLIVRLEWIHWSGSFGRLWRAALQLTFINLIQ